MGKKIIFIIDHCDECDHFHSGDFGMINGEWGWVDAECSVTQSKIGTNLVPPIKIPDWCPLEDA